MKKKKIKKCTIPGCAPSWVRKKKRVEIEREVERCEAEFRLIEKYERYFEF